MSEPTRADAVLVAGAPRSGVRSVAARLRERMSGLRIVETHELAPGEVPIAVVWVVSATAPMTPDECDRAAAIVARTDAVIAVVNKIDDHRRWQQVLAANRTRWPAVTWVAAAAAPRLGPPRTDQLVAALGRQLADPTLARRAIARAREAERAAHARGRRQLHQVRLELTSSVRQRCLGLRTELLAQVSTMSSRRQVEDMVRIRCEDLRADVSALFEARIARLTLPPVAAAPPPQNLPVPLTAGRGLETQLMVVLGAGFGVGAGLVVARLTAALTGPGWASALGATAGVVLTVWVVRVRGLLADRARWERWTADVVAALRIELEDAVAGRILAAMSAVEGAHGTPVAAGHDGFRGYRSVAGGTRPNKSSSESFL